MSSTTNDPDPRILSYVRGLSLSRESESLRRLREETAGLEMARMQISPEQGRLMGLLAATVGARRALEVGVFTGYSALCVAEALPSDGLLVACDVSEEWTRIARRYWEEAGVADRIDLRLGDAADTLAKLLDAGEAGTFDFAFIDADKQAYDRYYELCLTLLRPGGLLALDNAFMGGRACEPNPQEPGPAAVRALNAKVFADERVQPAIVPIGDGLLLVRKR